MKYEYHITCDLLCDIILCYDVLVYFHDAFTSCLLYCNDYV